MDTLEKLLKALPFTSFVARHPRLAKWLMWSLLVILGFALVVALVANIAYHLVLMDRDDIYATRLIQNTMLMITAPQVTHAKTKEYQFFLSPASTSMSVGRSVSVTGTPVTAVSPSGAAPSVMASATSPSATGVPTSTSRLKAAPTISTTVRIVGAEGIVLLPQQTLVFSFTPDTYQSYAVSYTNSFSQQWAGDAVVIISVDGQAGVAVPIFKEGPNYAFLRRVFVDNLERVLFTSIFPVVLISVAFFYDQISKEQVNEYNNRMDYIEKHLNTDVSDEYFSSSIKLLTDRYGSVSEDLQKNFDKIRYKMCINDISEIIIAGYIDRARQKYESLKSQPFFRSLSEESKKAVYDLISDEADIHLRHVESRSEYFEAHLAWLIYKYDKKLTVDMLKHALNNDGRFVLEKPLRDKVERLRRLRSMFPSQEKEFFTRGSTKDSFARSFFKERWKYKDHDKLYEVLDDFIDDLKLESHNQIAAVIGPPGSGKSQLLRRFIQNEMTSGVFYVWLSLRIKQDNIYTVTTSIQEAILQELFVLLVDNPNLWGVIEEEDRKVLGDVVSQRAYLFDRDPVNYLKSKSERSASTKDNQAQLIGWLQRCFRRAFWESEDHDKVESFIGDIGAILDKLGFDKVCFCLENVEYELDITSLLKILNGLLEQDIFLRLVYSNIPDTISDKVVRVEVVWNPDWFDRDPWLDYLPKFDSDDLYEHFKQQITMLGDMEPWLHIFAGNTNIAEDRWNEVYDAMVLARSERDSTASNWTMADEKRAAELLTKRERGS